LWLWEIYKISAIMKNRRSGIVEDIWMNTQAGLDDTDTIEREDSDDSVGWNEIERDNILLNPDAASMEDRG
jgi:hypothetical protein